MQVAGGREVKVLGEVEQRAERKENEGVQLGLRCELSVTSESAHLF